MEWDWRGHSASTTISDAVAWYLTYIVLAFEGIFLGLGEVGSYIYSYWIFHVQGEVREKPSVG